MSDYIVNSKNIRAADNLSENQKTGLLTVLMSVGKNDVVNLDIFETEEERDEYSHGLIRANLLIKQGDKYHINKDELKKQNYITYHEDLLAQGYKVYLHKTRDSGEVFYVGLSNNKRRPISTRSRSKQWKEIVRAHGRVVEIVKSDLNEKEAQALEIELIAYYGRIDQSTGTLCNHSDGGELGSKRNKSKRNRYAKLKLGKSINSS